MLDQATSRLRKVREIRVSPYVVALGGASCLGEMGQEAIRSGVDEAVDQEACLVAGQTEIGPLQKVLRARRQARSPGCQVAILGDEGKPAKPSWERAIAEIEARRS